MEPGGGAWAQRLYNSFSDFDEVFAAIVEYGLACLDSSHDRCLCVLVLGGILYDVDAPMHKYLMPSFLVMRTTSWKVLESSLFNVANSQCEFSLICLMLIIQLSMDLIKSCEELHCQE